jgi:serine/threonine protein kinase
MPTIKNLPARYSENGKSAEGGMGTVVFCHDSHLDRTVAIKFIKEKAHHRRMKDELDALLKMRSKHVVQIYDIVTPDIDTLGIVQEFIEGNDLFHEPFPRTSQDHYLKTIWQIAAGISDIHAADVIHRDIKPNNMKLDHEGIIKIFDFGLARDEGIKAVTRGFVGTTGFAAPELYTLDAKFTKAVDTYAFGATALYLATEDLPDELKQIPPRLLDNASYFNRLPFGLQPTLINLLDLCLHQEPTLRPSMESIKQEIARHLLVDKHQALVVFQGQPLYLNARNRSVTLNLPDIGKLDIAYDGFSFRVSNVSGEVLINNIAASVGDEIPGSCVVSLGDQNRRTNFRKFITFDVSNPEIVL